MKKLFPYILIVLIIMQMLAPFTVGIGVKNNLEVKSSKAEAAKTYYSYTTTDVDQKQTESYKYISEELCDEARVNAVIPQGAIAGPCQPTSSEPVAEAKDVSGLPVCMKGLVPQVGGCFAQLIYYALFIPTSYVFALAGTFFDFTFHYSIQSSSYSTPFVVEGWGLVRDFCNMFFIFILLYIAFKTILGLNLSKTKELVINVVIIGLLINFSLFATQVIIDTSNILARVFYNSDTIKITQGENAANGVQNTSLRPKLKIGPNGEIPLSEAIVNKVNPQNLIINGRKAVVIQDKVTGKESNAEKEGNLGTGAFILITLLAVAVNIVGIITFLSIGLIFVTRVIGLWMAMILAPFAFFSYTVPAMQEWEMVGWKKWWPETIKMAFLAPVFIFFMYIIIAFLEKGLSLVKSNETTDGTGTTFVISIIIPFVFIMVLLMKAKDIAKKMSGTMGEAITNGIKKYGGMALGVAGGVALGGLAMAGRATVGRGMNKLATSEWASTHGAIGRGLGNFGKWAGSGSLDLRGVKIAGKGLSDTGLKGLGKAKEGGYAKHLSEKVEKRQKRAKELEVHENEDLKQDLNKTENDLQDLLVTNAKEIESVDKLIEKKRQEASDADRNLKAAAPGKERDDAKIALKLANDEVKEAKLKKDSLRKGIDYTEKYGPNKGKIVGYSKSATINGKNIDSLETLQKTQAQNIKTENATRKGEYARDKAWWGGRANKEAEHKIIMETKLDSGTKT